MDRITSTEIHGLLCEQSEIILDVLVPLKERTTALYVYDVACCERSIRWTHNTWKPVLRPSLMRYEADDSSSKICALLVKYMQEYMEEVGIYINPGCASEIKGVLLSISNGTKHMWDVSQKRQFSTVIRVIIKESVDPVYVYAHVIVSRMLLNQIDSLFCQPIDSFNGKQSDR